MKVIPSMAEAKTAWLLWAVWVLDDASHFQATNRNHELMQ
jgi:hypothetical protein